MLFAYDTFLSLQRNDPVAKNLNIRHKRLHSGIDGMFLWKVFTLKVFINCEMP